MGKTVRLDKNSLIGKIAYLVFFLVIVITGLQVSNRYYLQLLTFIGINTLLTLGLNMLMGYAGQISLGHAAFFGLGAYTSAVFSGYWQCSPWLVLPLVLLAVAVVAFVVGVPTLKLSGYYLGMGTLGFGMIVYVVLREFIQLAGEINVSIPYYVVSKTVDALNERNKSIKGAKVLILGVAYKKDVDDARESPALAIMDLFQKKGATVFYHDPFIPFLPTFRKYHFKLNSSPLTKPLLQRLDAVVVVTDHSQVDYAWVVRHAPLIIDTRNVTKNMKHWSKKIVKA